MQSRNAPKVFLDANVVIAAGKPPGGPILARVGDLVEAGLITILTTDLTITEVAKKHIANEYSIVAEAGRPHFRRAIAEVTGVCLPEMSKSEIRAKLAEKIERSTRKMFEVLSAKALRIDTIKPSAVFDSYAKGAGLFSGEGKKDQFPDAFILECLKAEASEREPVIVVSSDGDFDKAAVCEAHIRVLKSIPDLFKDLGLQVQAPKIDGFLEERRDQLMEAADRELDDWGLVADVEDAQIDETKVVSAEMEEFSAFESAEEGGPILAVGRMNLKAKVSFTHPDWERAAYDSEDKRLIPFDEIIGETEVDLSVDVSMTIGVDDDGQPDAIKELRFCNSDFQYVELYPSDPWER